jgi:glycosyltransferase involved in cell wall biosynthesis
MTVDIISSVLDGERFLPALLHSLQEQTHTNWRLWVRDDGSTDGTVELLRASATFDPRIRLLHVGGPRLGVAGGFGWALSRIPESAAYVMCADADDVWLPFKIERTLERMVMIERAAPEGTPVLVHSDLIVVDEQLRVVHPSFWSYSGIDPEPAILRRIVVRNVATAPTVMMNRALRSLVGETPPQALFQDWWYALVASAFGRISAIREGTVLYRQHGANAVGAQRDSRVGLRELPGAIIKSVNRTSDFRRGLRQTAAQARAFLDRYGTRLNEGDRHFLVAYSQMPDRGFCRRKIDLLRLRALPEHGMLRTLSAFLRG